MLRVKNQVRLSLASRRLLIASVMLLPVCTPDFEGEYENPAKEEIIDDKWNETDGRKTAEIMVKGVLDKPWLKSFSTRHNEQKPIVIVTDVENRTDEHLDTKGLTEFIRDDLINSGRVRFVNAEQRKKVLDELDFQRSGAVDHSTAKKSGKQIGADFLYGGAVTSSVHTQKGLKTVTYTVNLTLTNIETSEIEMSQKHQIKKRFRQSGASF